MQALDSFEAQALNVMTGPAARKAFDISQEPEAVRELYGRNRWGQQCLLARRLIEAGVELVTTTLNGTICGRTGSWDDHAVYHHVFDAMKSRAPYFDQAGATRLVAAAIAARVKCSLPQRVALVPRSSCARNEV